MTALRSPRVLLAAAIAVCGLAAIALVPNQAQPAEDGLPGRLDVVGTNSLEARGLNSTVAIGRRHAYAGSFTDAGAEHGGVKILSITDPSGPRIVGAIPPDSGLAPIELRVWRREGLLIVLNDRCRPPACESLGSAQPDIRVYDVSGGRAARPRLLARRPITPDPHEFFLWQDPERPGRALAYVSTPAASGPNVSALDLSRVETGQIRELATWKLPADAGGRFGVHSVSITHDGRRALLSAYDLGYVLLSTGELAKGRRGADFRRLTAFGDRLDYERSNGHSFVATPSGRFALTTDEIFGCPWASMNVVDISDPRHPRLAGSARVPPYGDADGCAAATPVDPQTGEPTQSFSPHDPTATCDLAIVSWFGAGVQVFALGDPTAPPRVAQVRPTPLPRVDHEHPHLQGVVMHSYPIIQRGLIYVLDIRNGLYVLRYRGPHRADVSGTRFLEGNSNLSEPRCRPSRRAR